MTRFGILAEVRANPPQCRLGQISIAAIRRSGVAPPRIRKWAYAEGVLAGDTLIARKPLGFVAQMTQAVYAVALTGGVPVYPPMAFV